MFLSLLPTDYRSAKLLLCGPDAPPETNTNPYGGSTWSFNLHVATAESSPRTSVPVSQRPDRGAITVRPASEHAARNVPFAITATLPVLRRLAADGSPLTENGRSSARQASANKRTANQRARALELGESMAVIAPVPVPVRRPVLEDGEVVGYFNPDGSIG